MYVTIRVKAGGKKEEVVKRDGNTFEITVREEASGGEANRRAVELMRKYFKMEKGIVRIASGHRKPHKIFYIEDK